MKSLFVFLGILCLLLTGCMGTQEYYQTQSKYYKEQTAMTKAYLEYLNKQQPLVSVTAPDGTVMTVNQTQALKMPQIQAVENPIVKGIKTIVMSTPASLLAGGWAAKEIIKHSTGDIKANGESSVTTTSNSNNSAEFNSADEDIINDSPTTDSRSNYDNATSDPVVAEQPDPIVVDPVVVNQPDPIIFPAPGE